MTPPADGFLDALEELCGDKVVLEQEALVPVLLHLFLGEDAIPVRLAPLLEHRLCRGSCHALTHDIVLPHNTLEMTLRAIVFCNLAPRRAWRKAAPCSESQNITSARDKTDFASLRTYSGTVTSLLVRVSGVQLVVRLAEHSP